MKIEKGVASAYTPELYSTSTRTTAVGVMNGIDRLASILQPVLFTSLIYTSFQLTMAAFGSCYLLGFFSALTLTRETVNKPLKDSSLSDATENDMDNSSLYMSMMSPK